MERLAQAVQDLQARLAPALERVRFADRQAELATLDAKMAAPDFWSDRESAQATAKQQAQLKQLLGPWQALSQEADELADFVKLGDSGLEAELSTRLSAAETELERLLKDLRFSGEYDDHDAILTIQAGAGGTDAQDWAAMLRRMYLRWAEAENFKTELINETAGEEAGIKSASFTLSGRYAYGRLRGEHGVHRLVRLSPFNSDNLRQTSFAMVEVLPQIDRPDELELPDDELKIDVYRAGGHGGQSVNTTDSAVRVTHLPTGITVAIQNERSQLQNKETALKILRSKLAQLKLEQHQEQISQLKGPNQEAAWGNQIRSYVLHPYTQVKDLRTGYTTSEAQKVLDGALEPLIESYLDSTANTQ